MWYCICCRLNPGPTWRNKFSLANVRERKGFRIKPNIGHYEKCVKMVALMLAFDGAFGFVKGCFFTSLHFVMSCRLLSRAKTPRGVTSLKVIGARSQPHLCFLRQFQFESQAMYGTFFFLLVNQVHNMNIDYFSNPCHFWGSLQIVTSNLVIAKLSKWALTPCFSF